MLKLQMENTEVVVEKHLRHLDAMDYNSGVLGVWSVTVVFESVTGSGFQLL